jgi:hypothetical protein
MASYTLIEEFQRYSATQDFRNNVYANISVMALDVALLVILVPLIFWVLGLKRRRRNAAMARFYSMQLIREVVEIFLLAGGINNPSQELQEELKKGGIQSRESHQVYGNTPDLFKLLRLRMNRGDHVEGYKKLTDAHLAELRQRTQTLLSNLDQQVFLFAAVNQHSYCEKYFDARLLIYVLRDHFAGLDEQRSGSRPNVDDFKGMSTETARHFVAWFEEEKLKIDRINSVKFNLAFFIFVLRGLRALGHRTIVRRVRMRSKEPYLDPLASNLFSRVLRGIPGKTTLSDGEISKLLDLEPSQFQDYKLGYRRPSRIEEMQILLKTAPLVSDVVWTELVVSETLADIEHRRPGSAELDAVRANSIFGIVSLLSVEARSQEATMQTIMHLMFSLRPYR